MDVYNIKRLARLTGRGLYQTAKLAFVTVSPDDISAVWQQIPGIKKKVSNCKHTVK